MTQALQTYCGLQLPAKILYRARTVCHFRINVEKYAKSWNIVQYLTEISGRKILQKIHGWIPTYLSFVLKIQLIK